MLRQGSDPVGSLTLSLKPKLKTLDEEPATVASVSSSSSSPSPVMGVTGSVFSDKKHLLTSVRKTTRTNAGVRKKKLDEL